MTRTSRLGTAQLMTATLLLLVCGSCTPCECDEYTVVSFATEQALESGLYRIEITHDELTTCELDTRVTPSELTCDNDERIDVDVFATSVDLLLPHRIPESVEVQLELIATGARWGGEADVEVRLAPTDLENCDCAYGYAIGSLLELEAAP